VRWSGSSGVAPIAIFEEGDADDPPDLSVAFKARRGFSLGGRRPHPRMTLIGLHPRLIGRASRVHGLREFIEYAEKKGDVWFCLRIDLAG
jgi:peptidoglycan/xylan/chitin deacetylase (PgdA/CDA1 family)